MKTKLLSWTLLFLLMLPIIPLFGQAQETNHFADKFDPVQLDAVPVDKATAQFEATKANAETGDAQAQHNLADCYASGLGVAQDNVEALKWYRKSAEGNDAGAQWILGTCYVDGNGVAKDYVQAYKWFTLAAAQGFSLARVARNNIGASMTPDQIAEGKQLSAEFVPRKETPGSTSEFETIKAKAETGDAQAQYTLGVCYATGQGVAKDGAEAVKWYLKAADQGEVSAQAALGMAYGFGVGVPASQRESVKWTRRAAEQGDQYSQFQLAVDYRYGTSSVNDGVVLERDPTEAAKWYRKAAENTNSVFVGPGIDITAASEYWFGKLHMDGEGVAQDPTEAVKWLQKSAERGFLGAEQDLGFAYYDGNGVNQDYSEAMKWFRKAAEHPTPFSKLPGTPLSQFAIGLMYENGEGVPQDYAEALQWYRKAAEGGQADAQNNLGVMYFKGEGVPQDYVEAYKWYNLAAAQGQTNAIQNRDILAHSMTPDQIAKAQQLSKEFSPGKETPGSSSGNSASADTPTASGTGFFITDDGYLVSNYHVVKDANKVSLVTSAGTIPAKVVQVDEPNDIALLKADGQFAALPVASSRSVALGGTVATVGFPDPRLQGFAPKLAKGEIAALSGAGDSPCYFQISVPVQPGNSGGALVDERGNVIGIVSAKLDASAALAASGQLPENVNYAVKSSFLLSFLESVPDVSAKLKAPNTKDEKFEEVVKSAQDAAVLVLVY